MAIPLVWLGAATLATLAGIKYSNNLPKQRGYISILPGESSVQVRPVEGCIVCCEVFGVLDHTGIWVDGRIIELHGNGLIRSVSVERFLADRSGEHIYIACDDTQRPLVVPGTTERAVQHIYQYRKYDLLNNNCHRFVWESVADIDQPVNRFTDLNKHLCELHHCSVSWLQLQTN